MRSMVSEDRQMRLKFGVLHANITALRLAKFGRRNIRRANAGVSGLLKFFVRGSSNSNI